MKPIFFLSINNDLPGKTVLYGIKKSFLNYLANIAALGTSLFNIICKVFGLIYSKNFDNYKKIENLLSKDSKKPITLELNNFIQNDLN